MRACLMSLTLALAALPAAAFEMPEEEAAAQFVASNVIATFYHELGHALIDILQLPVLGREEDAADSLSALLTHQIWEEDAATRIIRDTAAAYALYAAAAEANGEELAFADVHSLDLQRYYSLVCHFYGANPEERQDIAAELELPEDRALGCEDEFALIEDSWGAMLDELQPTATSAGLRLDEALSPQDPIASLLAEEIASLNQTYGLPREVLVTIEDCGEANAYYEAGGSKITICTEYAPGILQLYLDGE